MFHDLGQAPAQEFFRPVQQQEFFRPLQQGQIWSPLQAGQTWGDVGMSMGQRIAITAGGAVVGALLLGPIGAIALGAGGFFASSKKKNLAKAGGY